ncbi:FACT complex subunit pob3 [Elaphomyces granulatus]
MFLFPLLVLRLWLVFRLRLIQYAPIKKFFLLPKNDDMHTLIVLGLGPPLRQGQTRYPFLVMRLKPDEEISIELNMTEELLRSQSKDKLEARYEEPIHQPATYIQLENISVITMSRVGGAISASRTFDISVSLKRGMGEHQFSNINRSSALIAAALDNDELLASSGGADQGSADEDEESSPSPMAEEYDSAHESSGSGSSGAEMGDASDAEKMEDEEEQRPKEESKIGGK